MCMCTSWKEAENVTPGQHKYFYRLPLNNQLFLLLYKNVIYLVK